MSGLLNSGMPSRRSTRENSTPLLRRSMLLLRTREAILLAFALVLSACSNDPNPPPYEKTRADGKPWAVRYAALTADPKSLDPQVMYDAISQRALEPVYDRLLDYHPMKNEPFELIPSLLEAVPQG